MATNAAEIEFVPDAQIDFVPDEAAIDFVPDEVVANEAQKATAGAVQALDVMAAPRSLDWTEVNAKLDEERFREAERLKAGWYQQEVTPERRAMREKELSLRAQISPNTPTGQYLARQAAGEAKAAQEVATTAERGSTPSEALGRFLSPAIGATVMPTVDAAGRSLGSAAGGAAGAALGAAATAGTGGLAFPLFFGIGGALTGSYFGGEAQEAILQTTETPEETQARQQRSAEAAVANPGANLLGGMLATAPFFGPSLAQFGRAASGDVGAITNIGVAGGIGALMEYGRATLNGEPAKMKDMAEAFFVNSVMNEPTRLGRKFGLHPSSEQMAVEEAQRKYAELPPPIPIGEAAPAPAPPAAPAARSAGPAKIGRTIFKPGEAPIKIDFVPDPNTATLPNGKAVPLAEVAPADSFVIAFRTRDGRVFADPNSRIHAQAYNEFPVLGSEKSIEPGFIINGEFLPGSQDGRNNPKALAAAQRARRESQHTTTTPDAQQISETGTPDGGVRAPEVQSTDALVPAAQSGEGVQPSGQGGPLAENAPEAPREVTPGDLWYQGVGPDGSPTSWVTSNLEKAKIYAKRRGDGRINVFTPDQVGETAFADQEGNLLSPQEYAKTQSQDTTIQTLRTEGQLPAPTKVLNADGEPIQSTSSPEPPPLTSIKNAVTEQERDARGISPAEEPARRAFGEVWDAAKVEAQQSPASVDGLVTELRKKPRALTDREDALLLHRQIELQKAFDTAAEEVNRATDAGDEPVRQEAQARLDRTRDALQELYDVGKQAGTETGRGLAARKMIANQDFNLAAMETRLRADNGGAPLTPEQQVKVKEQADTIQKTQAEMDRVLTEREAQKAEAEKAEGSLDPKIRSLADRIIARLDVTAANAAKSLRSKLFKLGSAPDPTIVLDVAKIAAAKTAKKAIEFAQWSAEMIKEFGEKVRPFLKDGWDQREQFIDAEVNKVTKKERRPRTDEEKAQSAIKARLTALANRTAELEKRTATGDFTPRRKPPADLSTNSEWVRLKAENDAAKQAYEDARYQARRAQRSRQQKVNDTVADTLSASRSVLASTDVSAPGRQGIFFTLPDLFLNPKRLTRQLGRMFRSQFSEKQFRETDAALRSRDNADIYEESGLYLADIDHKPSAREEQFKSEIAEKVPGVGRIVRGSSRGFAAFLNTVRADAMDAFVAWSGGKEKIHPETKKFLATAINEFTGRGEGTRALQGAMEWMAKYLFSPRLWVARYNLVRLKPIWRDPFNPNISLRARAVVASQYVKFLGALTALKWLAQMNGGKMEEDPRDSDFGKLQFGTKRYDVMGGIGNMVTLLARVVTRQTKDDRGRVLSTAWIGNKQPQRDLKLILASHFRNKMAPIPGAVFDYIYQQHPDKTRVTPGSLIKQTAVPITVSDTVGYFQNDNPAAALRDAAINAFGVTVQDYRK